MIEVEGPDGTIYEVNTDDENLARRKVRAYIAKQTRPDRYTETRGALSKVNQGSSFGFADEISGGVGGAIKGAGAFFDPTEGGYSVVDQDKGGWTLGQRLGAAGQAYGDTYKEIADKERAQAAQYQKERPIAGTAAEIGGGMLVPLKGYQALRSAGMGGRAALLTTGAAAGGLYGFGTGEGDVGDRAARAPGGAAAGAAGAAFFGAGGWLTGKAFGALGGIMSRWGATADQRTLRMIGRMMNDAKITPQQLQATANKVQAGGGSTEEFLFELLGEPGPRAARALFAVRGPSQQIAQDAFAARKAGVGQRVTQAASRATGVGGRQGIEEIGPFLERLGQERSAKAGPLYDTAYKDIIPDDVFARDLKPQMMGGGVQDKALAKAAEIADSELLRIQAEISAAQRQGNGALVQKLAGDIADARAAKGQIEALRAGTADPRIPQLQAALARNANNPAAKAKIEAQIAQIGRGPESVSVRAVDYYQRGLRSIAEGEGKGTTLGSAYEKNRSEFNKLADAEVPAFGEARKFVAQSKSQEEMVKEGTRVFEADDFEIASLTQSMTGADRDAWMVGVMRAIAEKVNRGDTAFVARLVRDKNLRAQLTEALGGSANARKFFGRVSREASMASNDNFVRTGSRTTPLAEDIKSLTSGEDELGFISELVQSGGSVKPWLLRKGAAAYDRLRSPGIYNQGVNEALGNRLFGQANTPQTKDLLAAMAQNKIGGYDAFIAAYERALGEGVGLTGGVVGAYSGSRRKEEPDVRAR